MKIQLLLFDGFDELDAIAPFEVLQNAAAAGGFEVELVTAEDVDIVTASHGLQIKPQGQISLDSKVDLLIVPGGNWNNPGARGVRTEIEQGRIPPIISHLHQTGAIIAGVCTGAMLIAEAGLLQGRNAITHYSAIADLRAKGAEIVQARVVDDGDIMTSGGVTSGLDLALWIVEKFAHPNIAQQVEMRMEYERRGIVWRRS